MPRVRLWFFNQHDSQNLPLHRKRESQQQRGIFVQIGVNLFLVGNRRARPPRGAVLRFFFTSRHRTGQQAVAQVNGVEEWKFIRRIAGGFHLAGQPVGLEEGKGRLFRVPQVDGRAFHTHQDRGDTYDRAKRFIQVIRTDHRLGNLQQGDGDIGFFSLRFEQADIINCHGRLVGDALDNRQAFVKNFIQALVAVSGE